MTTVFTSPIGGLLLTETNEALSGLEFTNSEAPQSTPSSPLLQRACTQLEEYFAGRRQVFDLPLLLEGSVFRKRVWLALQSIPYGKTASYTELAALAGSPRAFRAVGGANHHNPISVIVPCHRVIGADGSLTGYGGGLDRKKFLLDLEKQFKN